MAIDAHCDLVTERNYKDANWFLLRFWLRTVNYRLSATIGNRQIVADNREWRIIGWGGETNAIELRKSVHMALMVDSESDDC